MSEAVALRDLPPVEPVEVPSRLSQTFLKHFDACRRSAYLYRKHGGGGASHAMDRGSAFHLFAESATKILIEREEPRLEPDVAKTLMGEVIETHPELTIPMQDHDLLRMLAYHWAVGFPIDPRKVVAVERKFTLEVGGWTVSGKLDLAAIDGDTATIPDYKTSAHMPSQEEFEASFQTLLYALLFCFGTPEDGEPLGVGVNWFKVGEWYPRYLREDGEMQRRERLLSRTDLHERLEDLERTVKLAGEAFESWRFPAIAGSHCSICPCVSECPLPGHLRDHQGEINTPEEAAEAAESHQLETARLAALWKEIRNWAKANGRTVRYGQDMTLEFSYEERRETDLDGMRDAALEAAEYGRPFDPDEFVKVKPSTRFKKRRLTAAELEEEQSLEHAGSRDERYGAEAPF